MNLKILPGQILIKTEEELFNKASEERVVRVHSTQNKEIETKHSS